MPVAKAKGRPRQFDIDDVLDKALRVFWRQGFQGASLSDLLEATSLSKPSLYLAFGDKESLYLRCLDLYTSRLAATQLQELEGQKDARTAVEDLLRTMAQLQSDPALPGGCLVVNGTADCGNPGTPPAVEAALRRAAAGTTERLLKRLQRAERDGQLPLGTDAKHLASLFGAVLDATALMGKAGAPRKQIDQVVEGAMMVWPKTTKARPAGDHRVSRGR